MKIRDTGIVIDDRVFFIEINPHWVLSRRIAGILGRDDRIGVVGRSGDDHSWPV